VSRQREECLRRQVKYIHIKTQTRVFFNIFFFSSNKNSPSMLRVNLEGEKKHNFIRINVDNILEDTSRIERTFLSRAFRKRDQPFYPKYFLPISSLRLGALMNAITLIATERSRVHKKKIFIGTGIMRPENVLLFAGQFRELFSKRNTHTSVCSIQFFLRSRFSIPMERNFI